ncbi:MAG: serine/threonine protein kinase, partial [Myxococcota bacterium]
MGIVFEATQLSVGRRVAVKILSLEDAEAPVAHKRFVREARLISQLEHPNTIRLLDFGHTEARQPYLVMELLQGSPLDRAMRRSPFTVADTIHIGRQIAKSLAEAHSQRIVHRDLKPANVFLKEVYGEPLFVKLLDFGIARDYADDSGEMITSSGFVVGTVRYMSPEQARGEPLDGRSDLYALGCILTEMLTWQTLHAGLRPHELLRIIALGPTPTLPVVVSNDPRRGGLVDLLMQCRSSKRDLRPSDAEAFVAALDQLDQTQPAGIELPPPTVTVEVPAKLEVAEPSQAALDQPALDQPALDQTALDQTALDQTAVVRAVDADATVVHRISSGTAEC